MAAISSPLEPVTLHCPGSTAAAVILPGRGNACATATLAQGGVARRVVWSDDDYTAPESRPTSGGIPILCPYPGRLASTTMEFRGRKLELEPRDAFGRPMHGLVHERAWRVIDRRDAALTAEFRLSREAPDLLARWPADFRLVATWTLAPSMLSLALRLEPFGAMPAALGLHPYLPLPLVPGADAERCRLEVPARRWQPQHDLLPSGSLRPACERIGFPGSVPLAGVVLDDVFTDLESQDRRVTTRLVDPAGAEVRIDFDAAFSACVVFTPPHRRAVCIEPYTALPGTASFDESLGWRILEAGETLTASMTLSLIAGAAPNSKVL
jgi:aldose 1-epimerase